MGTILEAFATDNLLTGARSFEKDSEYGRAVDELCDAESKLVSHLDEPGKSLFEAFNEAHDEITYLTATDRFLYGYRLGVLMTMEVFAGSRDLIAKKMDE